MNMKSSMMSLLMAMSISGMEASLYSQNLWEPIANPGHANAIGISPAGNIYLSTTENKIFRSGDNGNTWENILNLNKVISQIAFNSSGHVFVGTQGQGLGRSTDEGATWTMISGGIPDGEVRDVAFGPGSIIYAGTFTAGMYRSMDNGATWTAINSGLPVKDIASVAVTPSGRILVGVKGSNGVYKSDDQGNSWTQTGMQQASRVYVMIVKADGHVFADTKEPDNGLFRSTDNGDSWKQIAFMGQEVGLHPQSVDASGNLYVGVPAAGHLYRTTDNGFSWQEFDSGITGAPSGAVISPNSYGFAGSSNGLSLFRTASILTTAESPSEIHDGLNLAQNYPNPFNPVTTITFVIKRTAHVSLKVFDVFGKVVETLVDGEKEPGTYHIPFDASRLSSGVYGYRLQTGSSIEVRQMILGK